MSKAKKAIAYEEAAKRVPKNLEELGKRDAVRDFTIRAHNTVNDGGDASFMPIPHSWMLDITGKPDSPDYERAYMEQWDRMCVAWRMEVERIAMNPNLDARFDLGWRFERAAARVTDEELAVYMSDECNDDW
jgi:hypothetical protein